MPLNNYFIIYHLSCNYVISSRLSFPNCTLLYFNLSDPEIADQGGMLTADDLQEKLSEVRGLISELDRIRTALQEEHANQLASNVSCAQM